MTKGTKRSLELYFAPIVSINNNKHIAYKTQVRINDDVLGIIMPDTFLHIADKTSQCKQVFSWTIEESIIAMKKLAFRYIDFEYFSIYGPKKVFEDEKIIDEFILKVNENGILFENFAFEVYLDCFLEKDSKALVNISKLREKGVKIILIDFASENFPVSKISFMPVDILSLDKFLIDCINGDTLEQEYARNIVNMAANFGKQVLALNINTQKDYDKICDFVDLGSGKHFGKFIKDRYIRRKS
jgi:EAL domain-containing protein (putative c-di-GMP-specific phosphodiesterase class I)